MRRVAARVHLWGGLVTGPLLLVLGLSGSALVFGPELEQALDGPPVIATTATSAPSLDAVVAAAVVGQPGAEPRALRLPARPDQPYRVELTVGGRRLDVAIDPSTLRVVDTRAPERSLLVAVRSLHAAFHAGRAGALLVGLLGVWLVVEGVTGLWLYGPWSGPRAIRRARGPSRALHRIVGGGSLVVGVVVGLTGTMLALASASLLVSPSLATGGLTRLDFVAERVPAHGRITALVAGPGHRVRVDARKPDGGVGSVVVDGDSGAIVATGVASTRDAWDVVRRLHAGDFAGWASRLVYAGVGLALPMLSITGFLISTRRRA
ncbi:MAG: hypothetical protein DMD76_05920 [Candidatus Rokuibacteriota bacterium]|nr:MAG: hypothetical protein DMD76_05920 [Candidatus Rokubacteria bacterium]